MITYAIQYLDYHKWKCCLAGKELSSISYVKRLNLQSFIASLVPKEVPFISNPKEPDGLVNYLTVMMIHSSYIHICNLPYWDLIQRRAMKFANLPTIECHVAWLLLSDLLRTMAPKIQAGNYGAIPIIYSFQQLTYFWNDAFE